MEFAKRVGQLTSALYLHIHFDNENACRYSLSSISFNDNKREISLKQPQKTNVQEMLQQLVSSQLERYRILRGDRVLNCFGDSHVLMFDDLQKQHLLKKTIIRCLTVNGATALGMVNPNSKTNALNTFRDALHSVSQGNYLLFMLGEVDCGFVIWYRAEKHQLSVDSQLEESLNSYQNFILDLRESGYAHILLTSAPLPTILDGQTWGEVSNARREVTATLRDRTDLTLRYNDRLRSFCQQNSFDFIDFERETLNPQMNLVDDSFRNPNPLDHHLNHEKLAPILAQKLRALGFT